MLIVKNKYNRKIKICMMQIVVIKRNSLTIAIIMIVEWSKFLVIY